MQLNLDEDLWEGPPLHDCDEHMDTLSIHWKYYSSMPDLPPSGFEQRIWEFCQALAKHDVVVPPDFSVPRIAAIIDKQARGDPLHRREEQDLFNSRYDVLYQKFDK